MRYANREERDSITYKVIFDKCADIYERCGRLPESSDQDPLYRGITRIQWTREWEYPFAILESNISMGMNCVDLGCGASPLPIILAENWCNVIGIDNNSFDANEYPNKVRLWGFHRLSPKVDYRFENLIKTSITDGWADRIYCIGVIEHMGADEFKPMQQEMYRILKRGGLATITQDFPPDYEVKPEDILYDGFKVISAPRQRKDDILNEGVKVFGWVLQKE